MKTNFEIIAEIKTLAEKQYGKNDMAFLWGCASGFLSVNELELILGILAEQEKISE